MYSYILIICTYAIGYIGGTPTWVISVSVPVLVLLLAVTAVVAILSIYYVKR